MQWRQDPSLRGTWWILFVARRHEFVRVVAGRFLRRHQPLAEQPWGFREFSVVDVDGNLVTFFEPPSGYDPRA